MATKAKNQSMLGSHQQLSTPQILMLVGILVVIGVAVKLLTHASGSTTYYEAKGPYGTSIADCDKNRKVCHHNGYLGQSVYAGTYGDAVWVSDPAYNNLNSAWFGPYQPIKSGHHYDAIFDIGSTGGPTAVKLDVYSTISKKVVAVWEVDNVREMSGYHLQFDAIGFDTSKMEYRVMVKEGQVFIKNVILSDDGVIPAVSVPKAPLNGVYK